jgi:hypothetical protein
MVQTTPNLDLPYPEPTDDVNLWEHFQALAEAVDAAAETPLVKLVQKATQNLTDATPAPITFGTGSQEILTHAGFHSVSVNNSRVTPDVPGYYEIRGSLYMAAATYTQLVVGISKNGTGINWEVARPDPASAASTGTVKTVFSANGTTDYFDLRGQQHSGGTRATNVAAGFESRLIVKYLRPL